MFLRRVLHPFRRVSGAFFQPLFTPNFRPIQQETLAIDPYKWVAPFTESPFFFTVNSSKSTIMEEGLARQLVTWELQNAQKKMREEEV